MRGRHGSRRAARPPGCRQPASRQTGRLVAEIGLRRSAECTCRQPNRDSARRPEAEVNASTAPDPLGKSSDKFVSRAVQSSVTVSGAVRGERNLVCELTALVGFRSGQQVAHD